MPAAPPGRVFIATQAWLVNLGRLVYGTIDVLIMAGRMAQSLGLDKTLTRDLASEYLRICSLKSDSEA